MRPSPRCASDWDPDWSPDGSRIVFAARRGPHSQLHTMRADGSDRRCVTCDASDKRCARWSPDGRRIAYSAAGANPATASIHVVCADGTGDVALTAGVAEDCHPAWSLDGERIVFQSSRRGPHRICTMSADGTDLRWVTSAACPGSDQTPDWGPPRLTGLPPTGGGFFAPRSALAAPLASRLGFPPYAAGAGHMRTRPHRHAPAPGDRLRPAPPTPARG